MLATKPEDLSVVPRTHMVKGKNQLSQAAHLHTQTVAHVHMNTQNK